MVFADSSFTYVVLNVLSVVSTKVATNVDTTDYEAPDHLSAFAADAMEYCCYSASKSTTTTNTFLSVVEC